MLGSIVNCLEQLVRSDHGDEQWERLLKTSGLPDTQRFYSHRVVDDEVVRSLFSSYVTVFECTEEELFDAFGKAWMAYAAYHYFAFFNRHKSARDFLLDMSRTHEKITDRVDHAMPPHFHYEEKEDGSLLMTYDSPRNLHKLWIGLIKGVGHHFKEELRIERVAENTTHIQFLSYQKVNLSEEQL
jgi:hypothetical protein